MSPELTSAAVFIVPTLCVGMQCEDALRPECVTQSVTRNIPTQSVGTIGNVG